MTKDKTLSSEAIRVGNILPYLDYLANHYFEMEYNDTRHKQWSFILNNWNDIIQDCVDNNIPVDQFSKTYKLRLKLIQPLE